MHLVPVLLWPLPWNEICSGSGWQRHSAGETHCSQGMAHREAGLVLGMKHERLVPQSFFLASHWSAVMTATIMIPCVFLLY